MSGQVKCSSRGRNTTAKVLTATNYFVLFGLVLFGFFVCLFFNPTKLNWSLSYSCNIFLFFFYLLESSKLEMSVCPVRVAAAVDNTSEALFSSSRSFYLRTDVWVFLVVYIREKNSKALEKTEEIEADLAFGVESSALFCCMTVYKPLPISAPLPSPVSQLVSGFHDTS